MNIEQIAYEEASGEMLDYFSKEQLAGYIERCLSKLAEQGGEPAGYFYQDHEGSWREAHDPAFKHNHTALYTSHQLIAAQQRTAEACANVAEDSEHGAVMSKYASIRECEAARHRAALIKEAIRNGEWREYL